jgi:peptide deformylase
VAQDRRGRKIKAAGHGLLGRAFQHELDHLAGKLYIDYLDSMDELIAVRAHADDDADGDGDGEASDGEAAGVRTPALA